MAGLYAGKKKEKDFIKETIKATYFEGTASNIFQGKFSFILG